MLKALFSWLASLFDTPPIPQTRDNQSVKRYVVRRERDVPDTPIDGALHLVVDGSGQAWLGVLRCPCGCGATIQLPMTASSRPCWYFRGSPARPSLWPSVRRSTGCRSHFLLRGGSVQWCREL
jgi:hypothetical protein